MRLLAALFLTVSLALSASAQSDWTDSLDLYLRTAHTPPNQYVWRWQDAPILHAMEFQYDRLPEAERDAYLEYTRRAIDRNLFWVNGTSPNAVASGVGLAFLYRVTGDPTYYNEARHVFMDFLRIPRTSNGGASHLIHAPELWDDTVYMIGVFLLSMYRATGDDLYIDELVAQIIAHREKLEVEEWGLWVHGWDDDEFQQFDFCSQLGWADEETGQSAEIWGRGNGWVVVTLSEMLNTLPEDHPQYAFAASALHDMVVRLPELQDPVTGLWYQLPVRAGEPGNYIESSCTSMFGFGLLTALQHGVISGSDYTQAMHRAYYGLRDHATAPITINGQQYLTTTNVAGETCIGDAGYYFNIDPISGPAYSLAMDVIFGRLYADVYLGGEPTAVQPGSPVTGMKIFPVPAAPGRSVSLTFRLEQTSAVGWELTDALGRHMDHRPARPLPAGANTMAIELPELPSGRYFLHLTDENGSTLATEPISIF